MEGRASKLQYGGPRIKPSQRDIWEQDLEEKKEAKGSDQNADISNDFSFFKNFNKPKTAKIKSMELMVSFISFSNLKAESIQRGSSD